MLAACQVSIGRSSRKVYRTTTNAILQQRTAKKDSYNTAEDRDHLNDRLSSFMATVVRPKIMTTPGWVGGPCHVFLVVHKTQSTGLSFDFLVSLAIKTTRKRTFDNSYLTCSRWSKSGSLLESQKLDTEKEREGSIPKRNVDSMRFIFFGMDTKETAIDTMRRTFLSNSNKTRRAFLTCLEQSHGASDRLWVKVKRGVLLFDESTSPAGFQKARWQERKAVRESGCRSGRRNIDDKEIPKHTWTGTLICCWF